MNFRSIAVAIYDFLPRNFKTRVHYRSLKRLVEQESRGKKDFQLLEIGARVGNTAVMWGTVLKNRGFVTTMDWWKDASIEAEFLGRMNGIPVKWIKGDSNDILPTLSSGYDFIFIDGGHSYTQTKNDILNSMKLLKDGGILCGDDLDYQANEVDQGIMNLHQEEETAYDPKVKRQYHPGVTKAVNEFFGIIPKDRVFWALRKRANQWEPITLI